MREQNAVAGRIAARLRDDGLLPGAVEQHYSAVQVAALLGRSPEFVTGLVRRGEMSPVIRDGVSVEKSSRLGKKSGAEMGLGGGKSLGKRGISEEVAIVMAAAGCADGQSNGKRGQGVDYQHAFGGDAGGDAGGVLFRSAVKQAWEVGDR